MFIILNGSELELSSPSLISLYDLIIEQKIDLQRRNIAAAVNGIVVKRGLWKEKHLCQGDRVDLVEAVYGG